MKQEYIYPFAAIVGQDEMKLALILNVIDPTLGGVLLRGEKGTAKSTAALLPPLHTVRGCRYRCAPTGGTLCADCAEKVSAGEQLAEETRPMRVVELPVNATEDRVAGTLDIEAAILEGKKKFEPGILAAANRNILYVDEVNLLEDHIVDILLDSAAMGVNTVEREGISYAHPARFVLVGTMNPEEGELRPQLLDRFALSVEIHGERDAAQRAEVVRRRLAYERDPAAFAEEYAEAQAALAARIAAAQERLASLVPDDESIDKAARISLELGVDGHRSDIVLIKTALAHAAYEGRDAIAADDLRAAAHLALAHRVRRRPFEETVVDWARVEEILA